MHKIMQRSRNLARLPSLSLLFEALFVAAKSLVRLNLLKTTKLNNDDNDRGSDEEPLQTNAGTREMRAFEMWSWKRCSFTFDYQNMCSCLLERKLLNDEQKNKTEQRMPNWTATENKRWTKSSNMNFTTTRTGKKGTETKIGFQINHLSSQRTYARFGCVVASVQKS